MYVPIYKLQEQIHYKNIYTKTNIIIHYWSSAATGPKKLIFLDTTLQDGLYHFAPIKGGQLDAKPNPSHAWNAWILQGTWLYEELTLWGKSLKLWGNHDSPTKSFRASGSYGNSYYLILRHRMVVFGPIISSQTSSPTIEIPGKGYMPRVDQHLRMAQCCHYNNDPKNVILTVH